MTVQLVSQRQRTPPAEPRGLAPTDSILPERVLPVPEMLLTQALVVLGCGAGWLIGAPWSLGAGLGLAVAMVAVAPVRGRAISRWAVARLSFWRQRRERQVRPDTRGMTLRWTPFDAEQVDGMQVGFNWDGRVLTSLVCIEENPQALTVLEPGVTVSGEVVPVKLLADCLHQFDISLDSVDVISQGARSAGNGHVAAVYDAVLGPLPAIAKRSVWVTIRMDPTQCSDAIRYRGGGWEGTLRTAATATRRVANQLSDTGLLVRVATAAEMTQSVTELSGGLSPGGLDETWQACHSGRLQLHSYAVSPAECTTEGFGSLWALRSLSTTTVLSLRPGRHRGEIRLRGLARFDGYGRTRVRGGGLTHLAGRQFDAFVCSLPLPTPRRQVGDWAVAASSDAIAELSLPAAGCGQVIGADEFGRAIALPLFGPRISRVEIFGTLHLAQQVVLRSLALGARVRVHTRRAGAWRAMIEQVGDSSLLQVTFADRGSIQAGSDRDYNVEMFDGAPEQAVRAGVTVMVARPSEASPVRHSDVRLQLLDGEGDVVLVSTRAGSSVVTMVATDEEMRFIGSSFDAVD